MNRRRTPPQSAALTRATSVLLAALWVSGIAWLALHYFAARADEFGVMHHPLEAPLLLAHGVAALAALFLLGWFAAHHAGAMSGRRQSRLSGWLLSAFLAVLAIAGCAQFFLVSESWQAGARLVHEICGALLLVPALMHLRRFRNADRRAAHAGVPERRRRLGPHSAHN
jgi:hypothetical protein